MARIRALSPTSRLTSTSKSARVAQLEAGKSGAEWLELTRVYSERRCCGCFVLRAPKGESDAHRQTSRAGLARIRPDRPRCRRRLRAAAPLRPKPARLEVPAGRPGDHRPAARSVDAAAVREPATHPRDVHSAERRSGHRLLRDPGGAVPSLVRPLRPERSDSAPSYSYDAH